MESIRISIIQTDIVWENKQENLRLLHEKLQSLRGITEIVVLPEMFSTGFSMQSKMLAEPNSGATITILKQWAAQFQLAICGSYIATENDQFYNRAFFLTPEGEEFYYDKRHLFRMGREAEHFSVGDKRLIIPYRGWNICLLVCYDLRFPCMEPERKQRVRPFNICSQLAYPPAVWFGTLCSGRVLWKINAMYAVSTGWV